jgi:hypothetical protein
MVSFDFGLSRGVLQTAFGVIRLFSGATANFYSIAVVLGKKICDDIYIMMNSYNHLKFPMQLLSVAGLATECSLSTQSTTCSFLPNLWSCF